MDEMGGMKALLGVIIPYQVFRKGFSDMILKREAQFASRL